MTSAADRPLRLTTALLAGGLLLVASAALAGNPQRDGDSKITRNAAGATPRTQDAGSSRNSPPPSSPPPRVAPSPPPPSHGSGGSVRGRNDGKIPSRDEAVRDRDSGHSRYRYRYPGHHYPYRYRYHGYYDPFYYPYYPSWLYWGWGPSYHGWYGGRGYGYGGPRVGGGYSGGGGGIGALDLDVVPESAEVWVDGERVGTADDFDGFPSYLWLEEGTYDVALYAPGYETLSRQYTVRPGSFVAVEDHLARGESVPPESLRSPSTENRDERLRRDEERREDAERWREAERWRDEEPEEDEDEARRDAPDGDDVARLHLRVFPGDAAVYLDGHFIGTGDELGRLSAGLIVEPGEHLVEAVRPGYQSRNREIEVEEGGQLEVDIDLTRP